MFMGSGHVQAGRVRRAGSRPPAATTTARPTNDRTNYYDQRAVERARARAVPRVGSHGLPARRDDAARRVDAPARRRQERAAPELREPPVRHGRRSCSARCSIPEGHPYHWPVIGYMEDLTAASYDDVVEFFKKYYAPANASLVVAGDIDPATRAGARREVVRRRQAGRRAPSR